MPDEITTNAVTGTTEAAALSDAAIQVLSASDFTGSAPVRSGSTIAFDDGTAAKLKALFDRLGVALPACWDEVVALAKKV